MPLQNKVTTIDPLAKNHISIKLRAIKARNLHLLNNIRQWKIGDVLFEQMNAIFGLVFVTGKGPRWSLRATVRDRSGAVHQLDMPA